jgi:predicted NUDIX family NTP pyrophosphohydrolase
MAATSAGLLLYRLSSAEVEVLLVHRLLEPGSPQVC